MRRFLLRGQGQSKGWYRIKPEVTSHVEFHRLNLIEPFSHSRRFPLIFCRNVMIYFDKPTQERLVNRLAEHLEPGGYLFVGLGWAVCYALIERFQPQSFKLSDSLVELGDRSQTLPHLLTYYSFVTLTTVGYGDVTPISPAARTLAWMEAITGQFYLGVIVAGLVSIIVANNSRIKPE
jgi:hypothetical protein